MTAAEITALVLGGSGILATLLTFATSARNTDLEAVKALVSSQATMITTLQKDLGDERAHSARLEQILMDRDRAIGQLRHDLDAAHEQIRELQGNA